MDSIRNLYYYFFNPPTYLKCIYLDIWCITTYNTMVMMTRYISDFTKALLDHPI